jgi:hypothetical protein
MTSEPIEHLLTVAGSIDDTLAFGLAPYAAQAPDRFAVGITAPGGSVTSALLIARLLGRSGRRWRALVTRQARSSATLLCLAADSISLDAPACLSPVDPFVGASALSEDGAQQLAAVDVRGIRPMAKDWFGLGEDHAAALFQLLGQQVFLPTLAALHRAESLVRDVGTELLERQLPDATPEERQAIIERLLNGYPSHAYPLLVEDCRDIGLAAVAMTAAERAALAHRAAFVERAQSVLFSVHPDAVVEHVVSDGVTARFHVVAPSGGGLPGQADEAWLTVDAEGEVSVAS